MMLEMVIPHLKSHTLPHLLLRRELGYDLLYKGFNNKESSYLEGGCQDLCKRGR